MCLGCFLLSRAVHDGQLHSKGGRKASLLWRLSCCEEPWSSRVPNVARRIDARAVRTLLISSSTLGTNHLRTYPPSKEHFGRSEASRSVPDHPGGSRGSQPVSAGLERSRASRAVSSVSSVSRAKVASMEARKTRFSMDPGKIDIMSKAISMVPARFHCRSAKDQRLACSI